MSTFDENQLVELAGSQHWLRPHVDEKVAVDGCLSLSDSSLLQQASSANVHIVINQQVESGRWHGSSSVHMGVEDGSEL